MFLLVVVALSLSLTTVSSTGVVAVFPQPPRPQINLQPNHQVQQQINIQGRPQIHLQPNHQVRPQINVQPNHQVRPQVNAQPNHQGKTLYVNTWNCKNPVTGDIYFVYHPLQRPYYTYGKYYLQQRNQYTKNQWICKNRSTGATVIVHSKDTPQHWPNQQVQPNHPQVQPNHPQVQPNHPQMQPTGMEHNPNQESMNINGEGLIDIRVGEGR